MSKLLYPILLLSVFWAGCKKQEGPTNLSMVIYDDSHLALSTTIVATTTISSSIVYVTGLNSPQDTTLTLSINSFRAGRATYTIENTGTSPNPNFCGATYSAGSYVVAALSGTIVVSAYSNNTISGSFDFSDAQSRVTGTFTAPTPH